MSKIAYFALFFLLRCINTQAFVKKPGIKSTLPVELINTPDGKSYLKEYDHRIIVPGTKWCGDGNNAKNYDDLGHFKETDLCCRDHDHCDNFIAAGGSNHGLHNNGSFTKLHCKCDLQFLNCLVETDCSCSGFVAAGYFNVLGAQCFDLKPPATCVETTIIGEKKRCIKYKYDETQPEKWQWFDIPKYVSKQKSNVYDTCTY